VNYLALLAAGAPSSVGAPNFGAWGHYIWFIVILCLIIFVVWWAWSQLAARVPEPLRTVLVVLGIIALALVVIFYVLLPLSGLF
jgi:hypothetical protein